VTSLGCSFAVFFATMGVNYLTGNPMSTGKSPVTGKLFDFR
jgi:hypothetical protein